MSTTIIRNFSGGVLTPALHSRTDLVKYATGLRTYRNFWTMRSGGAENRPGTVFGAEVADSTKTVRMIPWVFSDDQTYVLEFGNEYIRFHQDGALITEPGASILGVETACSVEAITQANPCVVTVTSANPGYFMSILRTAAGALDLGIGTLTNGDEVVFSGIAGMTELNGRNFKVANYNLATRQFSLQYMDGTNVDSSAFTAYTSGGTVRRVFEITSRRYTDLSFPTENYPPYLEANLSGIKYTQSADVMTITHPSYVAKELYRTLEYSWGIRHVDLQPDIAAPGNVTNTSVGVAGTAWRIIAVAEADEEESLSGVTQSAATPSGGATITVSWDAVTGALTYKIYRSLSASSNYALLSETTSTSYVDSGTAGTTQFPSTFGVNGIVGTLPVTLSSFKPDSVCYFQQRLFYANLSGYPERVWGSRVAHYNNFYDSVTLVDTDPIDFTAASRKVSAVRHLVDLGGLVICTQSNILFAEGVDGGSLVPTQPANIRPISQYGVSNLRPLIVGGNLIYVQDRGNIIRDLSGETREDRERDSDLTAFATHLFDGFEIVDWDYQCIPHSIVWAVRDDGKLLSLTYSQEHKIYAWAEHDTDGTFENVCVVPGDTKDDVYVVVKRTINGATKRYVERLENRLIDEDAPEDMIFMDSALTYDGRNTDTGHTMTLSGSGWTYSDELTLTSSASYFTAADVGNQIHLTGSDGTVIRFSITGYTGATLVTGKPHKTVPAAMQAAATSTWTRAVDELTNLHHLEGKAVAVFADGFVVASPNNSAYDTLTVTGGALTLPSPYGVIHVGLPYISDLETLDIDTAEGETLSDKKKLISKVHVKCFKSRGIWTGNHPGNDTLSGLTEAQIRETESYDEPTALKTGDVSIIIESTWNSNGRVLVRQVDPLPLTVLSVAPDGLIPFRR